MVYIISLMIIGAIVVLLCIGSSKLLYKVGVPTLLIFIALGMLFGSDGIGGIFFSNYNLAEKICSVGLVFIMFYGGMSTNWKIAKPVVPQAILMSTFGVIITTLLTGLFCYFVLKFSFLEGMLIGAIVGSTDAASVFAILRSRKLNLKDGLASLLEIESGSNDPIAYMLTVIILTFMSNGDQSIPKLLFTQITFGIALGIIIAIVAAYILKNVNFEIDGLYPIFVLAVAILSYSLSEYVGGNGYLCVYIVGIILGNSKILHKKSIIHFFDGVSWLAQIMIFFTLGLLSFPSLLPEIVIPALLVSIFMMFIARPLATFSILSWFKTPIKHQIFVSWVGLRGAASIVFAIFAITNDAMLKNDVFHMVFFIALFSVSVQGSLIPKLARKLDLVEETSSVLKTFNDYQEEAATKLIEVPINKDDKWENKSIMNANIPEEILVVMIKRKDEVIVPKGGTVIKDGDILVLSGEDFSSVLS